MTSRWLQNKALFIKEATEGYEWQKKVCTELCTAGIQTKLSEFSIRDSIEDIHKYANETDLKANGIVLEVKSRRLKFTSPEDYPYECALIDTVRGFAAKHRKPTFVLMISRPTGVILGVHTATSPLWYKSRKWDHIRGIKDEFYICRKKFLLTFDSVVRYLRDRQ